jgi:N-acetylgalactosamine-N,N'-diacetylbacillosaminyl-diphospho-undecaprenol 4-alpha-N-acetylgalactosaminyltransferase
MMRRRALFLINSLVGGGAERTMCTLLRYSTAEREEFDLTLGLLDIEPAAYAPPDWVEVRQFDCRGSLARSVARTPCVISERANTSAHLSDGLRGAASRALVRAFYPRAARVIAVSEGVAQDLRDNFGVRADRLVTIPNPVDVSVIEAKSREAPALDIGGPYVVAAGRLVKSKNFDMLIRAFALAGGSRKLVILGEGGERDALLRTAAECGLEGRVVLPGFVSNPYPVMRKAELFVLSSNSEGFPNALVEAMALGVPAISVNCRSGAHLRRTRRARSPERTRTAGRGAARHGGP